MKILLTGQTGFLGSNLFIFLKKKHKVENLNLRKLKEINRKNIFLELQNFKNISTIINCAASLQPKNSRDLDINQNLPLILQEYSRNNNIRFVHISTINTLFTKRLDLYTVSKRIAEKKLSSKYSTIVRLPLIINKNGEKILNQGEISFFFKYINCFKLPFYPFIYPGSNYRPLEITDICKFLLKLIYQKKNKVISLQGEYKVNSFNLFKLVCKQEQKKIFKINILWIEKIIPNFIQNYLCKSKLLQQILCLDNT